MKRRLIAIASALALSLGLTVPAGAQFIVETQAQTTIEAVLAEFPDPTPEDMLEIRNRSTGSAPLEYSGGYLLTDPTMGDGVNVILSSAPAQVAILSIPAYSWETDGASPRDTFVFQVPIGTVISGVDAGAWSLDYLGRSTVEGESLYDNTYFDQVEEYVAIREPMPITIETTDIYEFGFTDSIYGYVYVQGVEDMEPISPVDESETSDGQFTDVTTQDYFADPVVWAVENGITAGTGPDTFGPHNTCTTAQIITFLWRAYGSQAPTVTAPFLDISGDDYYADAAAWAWEKGLISGDVFGGNAPATRAATMTYLWKLAGQPNAGAAGFSDVPADADYATAVDRAVEEGITAGTGEDTFSPDSICTRAQIVTFLYKALVN